MTQMSPAASSIITFALTIIILGSAFILATSGLSLQALLAIAVVGGVLLGVWNGRYAMQRYREPAGLRRAMLWTAVTWLLLSALFLLNFGEQTRVNQRTALYFVVALGVASVLTLVMQLAHLRRLRR